MVPFFRDRVVFLLCFSVLGLGLLSFSSLPSGADVGDVMELEAMVICDLEVDEPPIERVERVIASRSTFQQTLLDWGFTAGAIHLLVQEVKPIYDLSRVMAGHRLAIGRASNGAFHDLEYHIDSEEYLSVRYDSGQYVASRHPYDFQVEVEEFYGEVDSSLWDTLVSQGESPQLVQALHQIFQWDIDFTAIRPGDSLRRRAGGKSIQHGVQDADWSSTRRRGRGTVCRCGSWSWCCACGTAACGEGLSLS